MQRQEPVEISMMAASPNLTQSGTGPAPALFLCGSAGEPSFCVDLWVETAPFVGHLWLTSYTNRPQTASIGGTNRHKNIFFAK